MVTVPPGPEAVRPGHRHGPVIDHKHLSACVGPGPRQFLWGNRRIRVCAVDVTDQPDHVFGVLGADRPGPFFVSLRRRLPFQFQEDLVRVIGRPVTEVLEYDDQSNLLSANLDLKNPNAAEAIEHLPPEELVADIIKKERQILALMDEIEQVLNTEVS